MSKRDIRECSEIVQLGWTAYEAMRRLGFKPDALTFLITGDAATMRLAAFLQLEQNDLRFLVNVGQLDERTPESVMDEWRRFFDDFVDSNAFDQDIMFQVYESKLLALGGSPALLMALARKGIMIPRLRD